MKQFTNDYLDDLLVRLAHHSSAIEGNTISLPETVSIILNESLPKGSGASIREFYEIENHKQAFDYIMTSLANNQELTIGLVKELHKNLTDRLQHDNGEFKATDNRIVGAELKTASPSETPYLVQQLVDNLTYRLKASSTEDEKLLAILDTHLQFERVHPFLDGNGRTGRLMMNYSLLKENMAPLIIRKENRAEYIEYLANQDVEGFFNFSKEILAEERQRQQDFVKSSKNQIE